MEELNALTHENLVQESKEQIFLFDDNSFPSTLQSAE